MVKRKRNFIRAKVALVGLLAGLVPGTIITPGPTAAHDAGVAFLGGLMGGHVLTNVARRSEERTRALQTMAYEQPRPVVQAVPAPQPAPAAAPQPAPASSSSSAQSIEQKLNTLDQLAAKGYITKQEYQARRQALLNTL